jgi:hypothetical protein
MTNEIEPASDPCEPAIYQIRIKGHLGPQWADWFAGLSVTLVDDGDTLLTGPVSDQAGLHGLLKKIRDLGMPLLSVNCIEPGHAEKPGTSPSTGRRFYGGFDR